MVANQSRRNYDLNNSFGRAKERRTKVGIWKSEPPGKSEIIISVLEGNEHHLIWLALRRPWLRKKGVFEASKPETDNEGRDPSQRCSCQDFGEDFFITGNDMWVSKPDEHRSPRAGDKEYSTDLKSS